MSSDIERISAARRAYAELGPRLLDGPPWPLAEDYGTGPEASWGPGEVLAHVEEMLPFWLGEMAAGDILERFVIGHAEDHIAQLTEILAARAD